MRIIAGRWRGRPLATAAGQATRPTAERTREALFSMLVSRLGDFEGLAVAASLYYLLNAAVLLICLRRRTRRVTGEPIVLEELASL